MSYVLPAMIAIAFVATLIRSTFGFGESLVAVPLLALIMPIDAAVPLSVLVSILVAIVVVIQDRGSIDFASVRWLVLFAALGIPVGLAGLIYIDERIAKVVLGSLIVVYSAYSMLAKRGLHLERDDRRWLFACGFLSGALGGAYGLNGPPLVVYGNLRRWDAQQFRATMQAYFLPASLLGFAGYAAKGLATASVARDFLWCLPAVLPAILLGRYFNRRIRGVRFYRYVHAGLVLLGALLVATTVLHA